MRAVRVIAGIAGWVLLGLALAWLLGCTLGSVWAAPFAAQAAVVAIFGCGVAAGVALIEASSR